MCLPSNKTKGRKALRTMFGFLNKLYLRIWLAVVLAIAVLTLLVGWLWRSNTEAIPMREVVLRNDKGEVIGQTVTRPVRVPGLGPEFAVPLKDGSTIYVLLPPRTRPPGEPPQQLQLAPRRPFGFFVLLGIIALAVALATYPVVRRLTKRLEALQNGVERFGDGDLSARVPVQGKDEVAFLAERFNQSAQRIQALVQSQKSLLANASHELRSPLARIRMGLEFLPLEASPGAHREISRSIQELDQLIDEILLASRLDAQAIDVGSFEPLDFTGLVAEECARLNVPLQAVPAQVQGVAKLLRRLVRNLLENARRYSPPESVEVSLQHDNNHWVLRVSDRGPGVPAQERERIFEPFYRAQGASEREGGVGLGLALVKSIAKRHGAQVYCEPRSGGGSHFVLQWPVKNDRLMNAGS
jgi:two-component system, OmpR family, sensor kinase